MGNFGRYVCVALPIALTIGSIIAMLVAGLAGVADKSLFMFDVNLTNLSINPATVANIVDEIGLKQRSADVPAAPVLSARLTADEIKAAAEEAAKAAGVSSDDVAAAAADIQSTNITAADLGLHDKYEVGLWGYCYTGDGDKRECTKPKFNWAETSLNKSASDVETLMTLSGQEIQLPDEIKDAIKAFGTVARWTQIVFMIAYVALAVELLFGLFASCSRAMSCVTFLVAGVATVAVCAAASLATATSVVVVGTIESTAKFYGVKADFNTKFLAAVWIGAAFAIAAGLFWMFTICCCKPERRDRGGGGSRGFGGKPRHLDEPDHEKLVGGGNGRAYQPLGEEQHAGHNGFYNRTSSWGPQSHYPSGGRAEQAYEPYSHARY